MTCVVGSALTNEATLRTTAVSQTCSAVKSTSIRELCIEIMAFLQVCENSRTRLDKTGISSKIIKLESSDFVRMTHLDEY